jgi:signal peptidase I
MRLHGIAIAAIAMSAMVIASEATGAIELFGYHCCWKVSSGSMKPTLKVGDTIASVKYRPGTEPTAGDIVVFKLPRNPSISYMHRLIGRPGDRLQMIKGALNVNGTPVARQQIEDFADVEDGKTTMVKRWRETLANGVSYETLDLVEDGFLDNTAVFTVPPEHYFMLGDNRDNASDSRVAQVGYIPAGNIEGRILKRGDPQ